MSRYIDADEAIRLYAHYEKWHSYDAFDLEPILNEMPTADVAEVKHGRWLYDDGAMHKCSVCGELSCCTSHFCGECGAKMDEVEDEN